jgi:sigma-70-like protein
MLRSAVTDILRRLDERATRVLVRRFGLDGAEPKTLHAIGAEEGVTRERIRQIEHVALTALRADLGEGARTGTTVRVQDALRSFLRDLGGVAREDVLASMLRLEPGGEQASLRFLLRSLRDIENVGETAAMVRHVRLSEHAPVDRILSSAREILGSAQHVVPDADFFREIHARANVDLVDPALQSVLSLARDLVRTPFGEWGLRGWAEATPRGVGDKAYIVLKREGRPTHFTGITERINAARFDRRTAHAQTVHNELIRDNRFVLVGRGLYALREWGYEPGTVADVLERVLRVQEKSLPREDLVAAVFKVRMVKRNTVLLALQNRSRFARRPDGTYDLTARNGTQEPHTEHTHSLSGNGGPPESPAHPNATSPAEDAQRGER